MTRAPHFEVYQGTHKVLGPSWFWRLRAANRKIIADGSEPYTSRSHVLRAVKRVRDAVNSKTEIRET